MSAYLTEAIIEGYIGTGAQAATLDSTAMTQAIEDASSMVDAALMNAGYSVPISGTVPGVVRLATLGIYLQLAYTVRRGLPVPASLERYTTLVDQIATGKVPIPGLEPVAENAVGGSDFTESDETVDGAVPELFGNLRSLI